MNNFYEQMELKVYKYAPGVVVLTNIVDYYKLLQAEWFNWDHYNYVGFWSELEQCFIVSEEGGFELRRLSKKQIDDDLFIHCL